MWHPTFNHKLFMGAFCPAVFSPSLWSRAVTCSQKPPHGTTLTMLLLSRLLRCTCLENTAPWPISGCQTMDRVFMEELKCHDVLLLEWKGARTCCGCSVLQKQLVPALPGALPAALAIISTEFLCNWKNCQVYREKDKLLF